MKKHPAPKMQYVKDGPKPDYIEMRIPLSHLAIAFNALLECLKIVDDLEWTDHEKSAAIQAVNDFHKTLDAHQVALRAGEQKL